MVYNLGSSTRWSELGSVIDRVDKYLEVEIFAYLDPANPIWRYRWSPVEFWRYDDKYKNEPAYRIVARESTNPPGRPWAKCFLKFDWAWIEHSTVTAKETDSGGLVGFSLDNSPNNSTQPQQVVAMNNLYN